jgi:hypothetical protein
MKLVTLTLFALLVVPPANAYTHTCGYSSVPGSPLNPTVWSNFSFTAQERADWQYWNAWHTYETPAYTQTTTWQGDPIDYPNPFYIAFTDTGQAGNTVSLESLFQFASMYYNVSGPYWVYWPPYEPDDCSSSGVPQL